MKRKEIQRGKDSRNRKDRKDRKDTGPSTAVPSVPEVPSVPLTPHAQPAPHAPPSPPGFIPPHGGYEDLLSFQKAQIVFDATVYFCDRFFSRFDRTHGQMVQAARSGKQNIAEGSQASGTSKETEIKLTNVARASLEELLIDYRDFLRNRGLEEWPLHHRYTRRLRELNRTPGANYEAFRKGIEHADPAISANVIIGLIKVTNFLLAQQIRALERAFLEHGGLREAMTRARLARRSSSRLQ